MYYLCNLLYQIIIILFIFLDLFKINLLVIQRLRKTLYFLFIILSTFVTPPEVVYQIMISICIVVVYELTIIQIIFKTELTEFKWVTN
jgi:sec-independent protein translocase protein TatC